MNPADPRHPLQVMPNHLRKSPCDQRCPEQWEIPLQPQGGGNVVAVVYGSQTTGAESKEECLARANLFSAAPKLLQILTRLTEKVHRVNNIQHSMGEVFDEDWSELYMLTNEAKSILSKVKGEQ